MIGSRFIIRCSSVSGKGLQEDIMSRHYRVGFWWKLALGFMSVSVQGLYSERCGLRNLYVKALAGGFRI